MSSFEPSQCVYETKASEEVSGSFSGARSNASEVFECFEEAFDEIAFGVECKVAFTFDRAILFWRDHRSAAAHTEAG